MSILFPYFELAASLFILLLAFDIYSRHYENRSARFFVRFAFVAFLACILTYSMRIAFTLGLAQTINRISASLIAFAFAIFAHFSLIFTKREKFLKNSFALPLLYIPPAVISGLFLFTNLMYKRYEILSFGIVSVPDISYFFFILQTVIYTFWGIILFFSFATTAPQKTERKQALLIGVGSTVAVFVGVVADQLLPTVTQSRLLFPTVVFDFALMNFFIFLAMQRYSLFAISPGMAAETIIETMPDSLIVTDLEGRVLLLNEEAHKYFHAPKEEILGQCIFNLFESKKAYDKLYAEVVNKGLEIERYKTNLCDPLGECLPSYINANVLRDKLGGLLGIIFVIRDIRG